MFSIEGLIITSGFIIVLRVAIVGTLEPGKTLQND